MENTLLNTLVEKLYNERGNFLMCDNIQNVDQEELQALLDTPSKHKNLVKGGNLTNMGYITVQLTSTGIRYFENGFKFDREKTEMQNVNIGTINQNGGNLAINNDGTQNNSVIINDIEEIIKKLNEKNIERKDEIIELLREFKQTENKNLLLDIFAILGNSASVGSLITSIYEIISQ